MSPVILPPALIEKGSGDPDVALFGTGESVPRGLEAVLEYNNLQMGDTRNIDCYFITQISGLGDADIRDSRENIPSDHGERAFNPYYGGRTIVISGFIRAFNITKLRDMQEALRTAFVELEEKPLYWRTTDLTKDVYINCRKIQPILMDEIQKDRNYTRDFQITLRASDPRFYSAQATVVSIDPNLISNPSFEDDTLGATPSNWTLSNPDAFASATLTTESYDGGHGTQGARLKGTKAADATQDILVAQTTVGDNTKGVTPSDLYKLATFVRIGTTANAPATGGIRASIDWYSSADAFISSIDGTLLSSGAEFEGDIMASGAAPATAIYAKPRVEIVTSTSSDYVELDIADARFFRIGEDNENDSANIPEVIITNEGNFKSLPKIVINGPMEKVEINNTTTEQQFLFDELESVPSDNSYEIDFSKRTLVDMSGNSVFGVVDHTSDNIELAPGDNYLTLETDMNGENNDSSVSIVFRSAWI